MFIKQAVCISILNMPILCRFALSANVNGASHRSAATSTVVFFFLLKHGAK